MAFSYALLSTVPFVAITPTLLDSVALTAALAPGSITPITGTWTSFRISLNAAAVEVLQAITIIFTFSETRNPAIFKAKCFT